MISVQKVRIKPRRGKGKTNGWFPQPLTHNTHGVCTEDLETKLPIHSLCASREWECEWCWVTTPNILSGQGLVLFSFGPTPPLIGEAKEVDEADPMGAFNRDPRDLVVYTPLGHRLVVNHLLEHDFLSHLQLDSPLEDPGRVPLREKAVIFNENPYHCGKAQGFWGRTVHGDYGDRSHHKHNPHQLHNLPASKGSQIVSSTQRRRGWGGGVGCNSAVLDMAEILCYDHTLQHLHHHAPLTLCLRALLLLNV